MNIKQRFSYSPTEFEKEKASTSYLMSLLAMIAGMPLPIINLIATIVFYLQHRKSTYFIRWHCIQALLSQFTLFFFNSASFWWTLSILFGPEEISNTYISFEFLVIILNISELAGTIYSATNVRKGVHVKWWFYGELTDLICKA